MCENKGITSICGGNDTDVDDAVGVSHAKWFIAIVNSRTEKAVYERLTKMGVESYLPIQEEIHVWKNGKKAKVERVIIPAKLFIHCTEKQRRELVKLPFIFRFMVNRTGTSSDTLCKPLATVSEKEIDTLKFMLGASDKRVTFEERFVKGEKVEVVRGAFKGLIGEVLKDTASESTRLYINIDFLGCASVEIDNIDVRHIEGRNPRR